MITRIYFGMTLVALLQFATADCWGQSSTPVEKLKWWAIKAPPPKGSECQLIRSPADLELSLMRLGWKATDGGFPKVNWSGGKLAAVITFTFGDQNLQPYTIGEPATIYLAAGQANHSRVFVTELDSEFVLSSGTCAVHWLSGGGGSTEWDRRGSRARYSTIR